MTTTAAPAINAANDSESLPLFIRMREISKLLGISESAITTAVKRGYFPKPIRLSCRTLAWRRADILNLLEYGIDIPEAAEAAQAIHPENCTSMPVHNATQADAAPRDDLDALATDLPDADQPVRIAALENDRVVAAKIAPAPQAKPAFAPGREKNGRSSWAKRRPGRASARVWR